MEKGAGEPAATEETDCNFEQIDLGGGEKNGENSLIHEHSRQSAGSPRTRRLRALFGKEGSVNTWQLVEVGSLVGLIVVVWALLLLPVVFYHLPGDEVDSVTGCAAYAISESSSQVCQDTMRDLQRVCLPNSTSLNTTDVYISPRGRTQQELEEILTIGLRVVRPSPQCEEVIVPFLCLYYLRPCDGGGEVTYRPSVEDCVTVSTEICSREWAEADDLLNSAGESLPSCEEIRSEESTQCGFVGNSSSELRNDSMPSGSAVQPATSSPATTPENSTHSEADVCTVYTGSVCYDQLLSLQNCIPGREGSQVVYISSDVDQTATESQVMLIQGSLMSPILSPSTECLDVVDPFLCLYYFGLCDISGNLFEPSTETCVAISTDICQREWSTAANFFALPTCDTFGEQSVTCNGTGLASTSGSGNISSSSRCPRECRDGFYCSPAGLCRARCDKWQQRSKSEVIVTDVVIIIAGLIGLLSGVLVLVLSCIQWKRMFTLPSIIIVYQTFTLLVLDVFVLLVYTDRKDLFCSTEDLQDSIDDPTTFCAITGVVFYHILLQLALWWLFLVTMLFWKICFPLFAQKFEVSHRLGMKLIHIACVSLALLVPWIPVIVVFDNGGFNNTSFPALLCTGKNADTTFYSLVIPLIILLQVGVSMLIVIIWTLLKQQGLFSLKLPAPPSLGTPEKKIAIASCYFVLLGVIAVTAFTDGVKDNEVVTREYEKYFICESGGINPVDPDECDRGGFEKYQTPGLTACAYFLLGMFPVVNLICALNVEGLKEFFRRFSKDSGNDQKCASSLDLTSDMVKKHRN